MMMMSQSFSTMHRGSKTLTGSKFGDLQEICSVSESKNFDCQTLLFVICLDDLWSDYEEKDLNNHPKS